MSEIKYFCMVMKINVDCNACCRKLRRIILRMKAIETHMIEKEHYRVIIFGRFKPSNIAIKIQRKMNRRVEILDVEEMDPDPPTATAAVDQNPPPPEQIQPPVLFPQGPNNSNHYQIPMFPSLEHDHGRPPMFPSLATANQYRSFSSSRPDFAVTRFPEPEMEECYWHYGYEFAGDRDSAYSVHNYYEY